MINSKLVGKTLPEIIHMIVFEELTSVTYHDGEYLESLLQKYISQEELADELQRCGDHNYDQGLIDGRREARDYENFRLCKRVTDLEQLLKENEIEFD